MTLPQRSLGTILVVFALAGCQSEQSDLERHAERCASTCNGAQQECSADPDFADPWSLACEVACNLDYNDAAHPFAACMDGAQSCDDKAACVDAGPIGSETGMELPEDDGDDDESHTTDPSTSTTGSTGVAESTGGESTGGPLEGHACCDVSGAPCGDPGVLECVCAHMPGCCGGAWGEVCASVAVANGCIEEGCSTLDGWTSWSCTCSTYDVFCPDDPFVSQVIFGTDACGMAQSDALAIAEAACEQGDGECTIGPGSCECECVDEATTCGPGQ